MSTLRLSHSIAEFSLHHHETQCSFDHIEVMGVVQILFKKCNPPLTSTR